MSEISLVEAILLTTFYRLRPLHSGNDIRSSSRWTGSEPVLTNEEDFFCYCLDAAFENSKTFPDSEARISTTSTHFSQVRLARL